MATPDRGRRVRFEQTMTPAQKRDAERAREIEKKREREAERETQRLPG